MRNIFNVSDILLVLILIFFLTSCATSHVAGKKFHGSNSINEPSVNNDEKIELRSAGGYTKNIKETQQSQNDGNTEGDNILNEITDIKENAREIETGGAIGDDELIENEIKRLMYEFGEDEDEVPQVFIDEVKGYIMLFQTNPHLRKFITASLERAAKYMLMTKAFLGKKGIPEDMAYIAFIESGFNPHAVSRAGAVGMWQFMPHTARDYSLTVNRKIDERRNPVKSTYAAVDYFQDLISIFGPRSFLLAMAAYNSGEGKIISCLREIENPMEERNFWHIRPCLAEETREFPQKIIAAAIIGNNPEVFGFPSFDRNEDEIVNPVVFAEYKPDSENPQKTTAHKSSRESMKPKAIIYTVKKGNSLSLIAETFGVKGSDIRRWNRMKSEKLFAGQKLKIYTENQMESVRYKVRKGDTVIEISRKFKVRPAYIIVCNGLKNGWDIKVGQTLILYKTIQKKATVYTAKKAQT